MQENFPQDKMLVSRWPDQWWVRAWKKHPADILR